MSIQTFTKLTLLLQVNNHKMLENNAI